MKGIKEFIVHIPEKYSKTFKTESGFELEADRRFSLKLVANTVIEVVELPFNYDGPIKPGDTLFVDVTVLTYQAYVKGGEQENRNIIDRDNNLYKIHPSMILMYKPSGGEWIAHNDNVLLERVPCKTQEIKSSLIYTPDSSIKKFEKGKGSIAFINNQLEVQGLKLDDVVYLKNGLLVDVWFNNKQYMWTKNKYLIAVEIKKAA